VQARAQAVEAIDHLVKWTRAAGPTAAAVCTRDWPVLEELQVGRLDPAAAPLHTAATFMLMDLRAGSAATAAAGATETPASAAAVLGGLDVNFVASALGILVRHPGVRTAKPSVQHSVVKYLLQMWSRARFDHSGSGLGSSPASGNGGRGGVGTEASA